MIAVVPPAAVAARDRPRSPSDGIDRARSDRRGRRRPDARSGGAAVPARRPLEAIAAMTRRGSPSACPVPGSNLRALARGRGRGELGGEIVLVFADRACPALDWAAEQGHRDGRRPRSPGGDRSAVAGGLDAWRRRCRRSGGRRRARRIHADRRAGASWRRSAAGSSTRIRRSCRPSPARTPSRDALAHGVTVTGRTVHLVDATLDGGPIVAQEAVAVLPGDDEAALHARIRAVEHRLLPRAVALAPGGALTVGPDGRRVDVDLERAEATLPRRRAARSCPSRTRPASSTFGARARRGRLRARLDRRHRPGAARGRPAGDGRRRGDRLPGDARRPGQDAPSAGPRRDPRRSAPGRPSPPAARRGDRPVRARRREPLPVRRRRRAARASPSTSWSRRSTSAGRRWSGRPPRTTPTSRS